MAFCFALVDISLDSIVLLGHAGQQVFYCCKNIPSLFPSIRTHFPTFYPFHPQFSRVYVCVFMCVHVCCTPAVPQERPQRAGSETERGHPSRGGDRQPPHRPDAHEVRGGGAPCS